MYKVGDLVRILPRKGIDTDYSFYYTDVMNQEYAGKTAMIISIEKGRGHKGIIPDDWQIYYLDIDASRWQWASSMLELVTDSIKDTVSEIRNVLEVKDDQKYELNFNL